MEWWHVGGLLLGLLAAPYFLINQHFRIEPRLLMLWRGFGAAALLAPILLFTGPLPHDPVFYAATLGSGLCIGAFDRILFSSSAVYGAGVTSRLTALCIPLAFVFWLGLHPEHLEALMEKKYIWLAPLALIGSVAFALSMRRDPLSRVVVISLVPVYFLGAFIDVLNKTATMHGNGMAGFVLYGVITALTAACVNLLWVTPGATRISLAGVMARPVILGGTCLACVTALFVVIKASSLASAPNPAFVGALNLTGPVWVMLWNIWQKHPDNSNILAGFGCVASALLLVFATL